MGPAADGALFAGDGTQAPTPADTFDDPLSGPAVGPGDRVGDDVEPTRIATPVQPDSAAVRQMVSATLGEQADQGAVAGAAPPPQNYAPALPAQPLGILPQHRTWPARQVLRPRRPRRRLGRPPQANQPIRRAKPSSGSTGVIAAVVLMIVFAVIAIQLLSSLISSIVGIFD